MQTPRIAVLSLSALLGITAGCSSTDGSGEGADSATTNHCEIRYSGVDGAVLGDEAFSADSKLDADGSSVNTVEILGFAAVQCSREAKHPDGGRDAAGFNLRTLPPLTKIEASESTANYENLSFNAQGVVDGKQYDYACSHGVAASSPAVGTFQLNLSSVRRVSGGEIQAYIVHGTAHGVCPGIENGHPKSPGSVTFDLTL